MKKNYHSFFAILLLAAMLLTACSSGTVQDNGSGEGSNTATPSTTPTNYTELFQKDTVMEIRITIADADWESILADPQAEEYKSATVSVNGITVENAGFRTKGNLTLNSVANSDSDRYSFRIKLDKYVEDQTLLGLDEFVVNNMYSDPTYLREYLSYEALASVGETVPLNAFANIYINDELFGFYLCIEAIDDSFLERNFSSSDGNLYKQDIGSSLLTEENEAYETYEQKNGDDESKTDLKKLIEVLNDMPEGEKGDIESVLDVDSALRYIAGNTALGNYDSYSGDKAQNYYLYGLDGKFTVIPWDFNMSIAGYMGASTGTSIDEPVSGTTMDARPLIKNLLAVSEYKERYYQYLEQYLAYFDNFQDRVTELANLIRPYVEADPTKFTTLEQFEAGITYSEASVDSNSGGFSGGGQMPDGNTTGGAIQFPEGGQFPGNTSGGAIQFPEGGQFPGSTSGGAIQFPEGGQFPGGNGGQGGSNMPGGNTTGGGINGGFTPGQGEQPGQGEGQDGQGGQGQGGGQRGQGRPDMNGDTTSGGGISGGFDPGRGGQGGQGGQGGRGGNMTSNISITSFILQRAESIRQQLERKAR